MADTIGTTLKAEGAAEFRSQMNSATESVRAMDSQIKLSAAAFENTTDKVGNLKERSSLLKSEMDSQSSKIELMNKHLGDLKTAYGNNSDEVKKYQVQIDKANTELEKTKTKLKETNTALNENRTVLGMSSDKWKSTGEAISNVGSKLTMVSAGATAALGYAFTKASDLNENVSKANVVFGEAGASAQKFADTTLKSYGISQSSALDMISTFGDMATSMGITQDEAEKMGEQLVGRAGDMASFKNISLDVAKTGLNAIFTGQTESLRKLGVVMTEANLDAYALANGYGKTTKDMTEAEKVMLRYQFVLEKTNNSAGDYARTADGAANTMRTMKETLNETAASLGEQLIPVLVPLMQSATSFLETINNLDDGQKKLIVDGIGILAVAAPALKIVGGLTTGVGQLIEKFPGIASAASGMFASVQGSLAALNISIAGTPVGLILAAIAAGITVTALITKWLQNKEPTVEDNWNSLGYSKVASNMSSYYSDQDKITTLGGETYVKSGSTYDWSSYIADKNGWEDSAYYKGGSAASTSNSYSTVNNINVQNVDDLNSLLKTVDNSQQYSRMGVTG